LKVILDTSKQDTRYELLTDDCKVSCAIAWANG